MSCPLTLIPVVFRLCLSDFNFLGEVGKVPLLSNPGDFLVGNAAVYPQASVSQASESFLFKFHYCNSAVEFNVILFHVFFLFQ